MAQGDLDRERETVTNLKATITQQSTTQVTMTGQVNALQAQLSALQMTLDQTSNNGTQLSVQLERERKRVAELEVEMRKAETTRRRLHNMVQELKVGDAFLVARVLLTRKCRATYACSAASDPCCPLISTVMRKTLPRCLSSTLPAQTFPTQTSLTTRRSSCVLPARAPRARSARISGPSPLIRYALASLTGASRLVPYSLHRYSNRARPKLRSSRRSHSSRRAARMATTFACSRMARPGPESRSLWKVVPYVVVLHACISHLC